MFRSGVIDQALFFVGRTFVLSGELCFSLLTGLGLLVLIHPGNSLFVVLIDDCRDEWFPSSL